MADELRVEAAADYHRAKMVAAKTKHATQMRALKAGRMGHGATRDPRDHWDAGKEKALDKAEEQVHRLRGALSESEDENKRLRKQVCASAVPIACEWFAADRVSCL